MDTIVFKKSDALKFVSSLEDNSVHLCLTDPPYAISKKTGFADGKPTGKDTDRFRVNYEFGEWDTVDLPYFKSVFDEVYRKLKSGGTLIVWYDLWKLQELKELLEGVGFKQFRFIEWVKTNPVPLNSKRNYLTNSREVAISCVKGGKPTFNSSYDNGVYSYPIYHGKDRFHTTQKSLQLFEDLVLKHSKEGDIVLDMFSGSGTTLLAANKNNRIAVGCEISEEYYIKAKERLNEQIK